MDKIVYKDIIAFHPGTYIKDLAEEMEFTQEELAKRLDMTPKNLSQIITGKASITPKVAMKLSNMTGTSVEVWTNLQMTFDNKLQEIERLKTIDEELEVLSQLDYKYFVNLNFLEDAQDNVGKVMNLMKYLKVASLKILKNETHLVQFKLANKSNINEKMLITSNAWVQTVLNEGEKIQVETFDHKKLEQSISKLKKFTLCKDLSFVSEVRKILARCGVAFVVLPSIKGSNVTAAVKWVDGGQKAILGITDRNKTSDVFWFAFFHEIKHVLQQKKKILISSNDELSDLEVEADEFARKTLISDEQFNVLLSQRLNKDNIVNFAKKIGIHEGIVVGRLQNEQKLKRFSHNDLKCKYEISDVSMITSTQ